MLECHCHDKPSCSLISSIPAVVTASLPIPERMIQIAFEIENMRQCNPQGGGTKHLPFRTNAPSTNIEGQVRFVFTSAGSSTLTPTPMET